MLCGWFLPEFDLGSVSTALSPESKLSPGRLGAPEGSPVTVAPRESSVILAPAHAPFYDVDAVRVRGEFLCQYS
jgi:hypothetical protein